MLYTCILITSQTGSFRFRFEKPTACHKKKHYNFQSKRYSFSNICEPIFFYSLLPRQCEVDSYKEALALLDVTHVFVNFTKLWEDGCTASASISESAQRNTQHADAGQGQHFEDI